LVALAIAAGAPALAGAQPKPPSKAPPKASPSAAPSVSAAPDDGPAAWFAKGSAAHEAGKYAEARELFLKVWAVNKAWDVAANLGLSELNLNMHVEAAEHLSYALRWFPASEPASTKEVLERRLAAAKAEVATVNVKVNVDGARVSINEQPRGAAPLESDVFVTPGKVRVSAQKEGYDAASKVADVPKGEHATVELTLVATPAPAKELPKWPVLVGGGLAVVALGAGIGVTVAGSDKGNAALKVSDDIYNAHRSCIIGAANYDARCDSVKSESSTADGMNRAGIGLLVGGGVLAAGSAVYAIFALRSGAKDSAVVVPVISPTGAGAVVRGSF
jgi:hypothetical protein